MKCHGCGHTFPETSPRCPRCHRSSSRRSRNSKDSRLLEFPKRARVSAPVTGPSLPAWRIELNEKVRAIRAKRTSPSPGEAAAEATAASFELNAAAAAEPKLEERFPATSRITTRAEVGSQSETPARRSSTNIVEAALTRVKRASENASRAALPKIEPARHIQASAQVALAIDREATARALEAVPEVEPQIELTPAPSAEVVPSSITRPINIEPPSREPQVLEAVAAPEPVAPTIAAEDEAVPVALSAIDEIEPLDYLEAEIRKVDKTLGSQFLRNESASLVTHAVIGVVDLVAVLAACSPFLAIIRIADGSFANSQTTLAAGIVTTLVSFFYLALTQCLCGRTFGMMLTNTRVVDAMSFESLSASRVLLRTAGYFISAAPALLGFLWVASNRKRRGWHDIISRTMVVRDF